MNRRSLLRLLGFAPVAAPLAAAAAAARSYGLTGATFIEIGALDIVETDLSAPAFGPYRPSLLVRASSPATARADLIKSYAELAPLDDLDHEPVRIETAPAYGSSAGPAETSGRLEEARQRASGAVQPEACVAPPHPFPSEDPTFLALYGLDHVGCAEALS